MGDVLDNATIRRNIGERIRTARGDRTLRDIADAVRDAGISVSPQAVSLWENGTALPAPATQLLLAEVLGLPHAELFGFGGEAA